MKTYTRISIDPPSRIEAEQCSIHVHQRECYLSQRAWHLPPECSGWLKPTQALVTLDFGGIRQMKALWEFCSKQIHSLCRSYVSLWPKWLKAPG